MIVAALLSLTGCDALTKAKDTLDGLLEPVVAEGIVLGIERPQGAGVDAIFAGSAYDAGTQVTVFLADAKEVAEIENAPISGAVVTLDGASVPEVDDGVYTRVPDGGLPYIAEAQWDLVVERTDGENDYRGVASLTLPQDHDFQDQVPAQHTLNTPIDLDFTGLGYDAGLIVVLDQDGLAYSNEPRTVREVYDFTHGDNDLEVLTIPGEVFDAETLYLVGVAGMVNTRAADFDEMNTGLSSVMSGKMRFYAVSTVVLPVP